MKKLLIFAAFCCACFGARADDSDTVRAAVRGATSASAAQQAPAATDARTSRPNANQQTSQSKTQQVSARGGTAQDNTRAQSVSTRSAIPQTTAARTATTAPQTREVSQRQTAARTAVSPTSSPSAPIGGKLIPGTTRGAAQSRAAVNTGQPALGAARSASVARAASRLVGAATSGYKACRDTYFSCMDEFCANKDAQLKRCACSKRIHDFDAIRQNLNDAQQKLLDFSGRLLAVNMDKEDVAAMNTATEGELAAQPTDKSASQKMIDDIMKKLQSDSTKTSQMQSLAAITLSMDTDVFDTVDSTQGMATAAKEGEALYRAALPVCVDMAKEVCADDEISTVQSAYQAAIEQDCNTVQKTYQGMTDKALASVKDQSALLDISRLQNEQTRTSDDVLTCKKKMLDAMHNDAVCGADLGKCLDYSGRYIDPQSGAAILSKDLANISTLIKRPTGSETWARTNKPFVDLLNSKKKYIEPAMKNCENLSDTIWDTFLEDALAQIKLAQGQKLEDMRQSCTTLTAQCLTNAMQSLTDFDSRSLSIFGVSADKTANQMCNDVKSACTALIDGVNWSDEGTWSNAITGIAQTQTYQQILATCGEVGKACITRNCQNFESNFGMCATDTNMRANILNRTLCWQDVSDCVKSAGGASLMAIMSSSTDFSGIWPQTLNSPYNTWDPLSHDFSEIWLPNSPTGTTGLDSYWRNSSIFQWCRHGNSEEATTNWPIFNPLCLITERIWGNCTNDPKKEILNDGTAIYDSQGNILSGFTVPSPIIKSDDALSADTLMAWLSSNTGNTSCNGRICPPGLDYYTGRGCMNNNSKTKDGDFCENHLNIGSYTNSDGGTDTWTNCCSTNKYDWKGNCCNNNNGQTQIDATYYYAIATAPDNFTNASNPDYPAHICIPTNGGTAYLVAINGSDLIFCVSSNNTNPLNFNTSTSNTDCAGNIIVIPANGGVYSNPNPDVDHGAQLDIKNFYSYDYNNNTRCYFDINSSTWPLSSTVSYCPVTSPNNWQIQITQ